MGKSITIMRQFCVPITLKNPNIKNKPFEYLEKKYGIKISSLERNKRKKLIPKTLISVVGIPKNVHWFVGDVFDFKKVEKKWNKLLKGKK
ncbi:hypothetical protein A2567_00235 [Candidatus Azambacteria bacterium RIFOXYD1_FULL_42_11]|uniref:Uncharacterized protein n=3 Tax=Candidatus Azamiibacteriota TaxID=1752741 RepID=A0A0G0Z994_9BACT|nr:MAG: hypothetical protein UV10_C0030G0005 [Candidatus Azambacteria bacterium GW2011_GWA1_42_19]KKS88384.1 MAG: hypothetical protein UV62_C0008G0003 [Parcubacteria group bacterium GW2011_GWC1_43_11]OGD43054.1 MAG: hypothetical protein A2567_00235 [Candidatus Azambacteria bacterium RIFOXYD1_FULL_42_11]